MKLPQIDLHTLPDLELMTGVFGTTRTPGHDDAIIVMAVIVYDATTGAAGLF